MSTFIIIDPNTFAVEVKASIDSPFIPTEETVEIKKKSREIQDQLKDFLDSKHNPMVKDLIAMVDTFNKKANPEWAQQLAQQELEKSKEAAKLLTEDTKQQTDKKKSWAETFKLSRKKGGKK